MDYNEKIGWLPASYADDVDIFPIVATPTRLPKNTVAPTRTPVPTATMASISPKDWEVLIKLVKKDLRGVGRDPATATLAQLHSWTSQIAGKMRKALERFPDLTIVELAKVLDKYAQMVDDAGKSKKLQAAISWDLAETLAERPEENRHSCRKVTIQRRRWIIAEYGEEQYEREMTTVRLPGTTDLKLVEKRLDKQGEQKKSAYGRTELLVKSV